MTPQDFNEWRLALQAPWGRVGVAVALTAALAILVLSAIGTRGERGARRRASLLLLRLGSTVCALVLFLQPAIQLENVTRLPNRIAVLLDRSASMGLREEPGAPSRAERAARFVESAAPALAAWRKQHAIDFYTFGDPDKTDPQPATEEALARVPAPGAPGGDATRIREALASLRTRYEGPDLGGVLLISDGIDHGRLGQALDGEKLDAEGRDFLRSLDAPVHTAWTGHPGLRDVAIARVLADDFAFARNAVKVEAVLRVLGARDAGWAGQRLPVTLRRDGVTVRTVEIDVDPKRPEQTVTFEFTPDRVGKYVYEISTPVLSGDAIPENNARTFLLKVIRDKIRVLLVAGRPSWDERFLRGLLKHNPNVDLISFFILRTMSDLEVVPPEEMSLIPFPTEELFLEQLRSFDLVFLQDFDFEPYGIGAYLGEIRNYVLEGGALAMLGGTLSFTSGGYSGSPVADVLPVELLEPGPDDKLLSLEPFKMRLAPEGRSHPITALKLEARENGARWEALPPLEGVNKVARARPGATVLGEHPFLRDADGKSLPVLVVQDVGKGRSLAFTSDSSWRWGFGTANLPEGDDTRGHGYQKFWENAIRWLVRDPELRLLRVETDHPEYRRGEKVRVAVRALDPEYRPARDVEVSLSVARIAGPTNGAEPLAGKSVRTDENGEASIELPPLPPGGYRVTGRAAKVARGGSRDRTAAPSPRPEGGAALAAANQDDEVFLVRGATQELEDAEARAGLLRAIAEATGGAWLGELPAPSALSDLAFRPPEVIRVNNHRDLELWSTWLTLLVAAACLSAEWAIRRRGGLP